MNFHILKKKIKIIVNTKEFKKLLLILLIPVSYLITKLAAIIPNIVERVYSRAIYKFFSQIISFIFGWIPISVGEVVILLIIPTTVFVIVKGIIKIIKSPHQRARIFLNYLLNIFVIISLIYTSSVLIFDINYQRQPYYQIAGLDVRPASTEELTAVCDSLIKHANELRKKVKQNSNGIMKLSSSRSYIFANASKGYSVLSGANPVLGGKYSNPKGVIFSRVMTLMGIQGIHNPFTQEANINTEISDCMLPSTACHEMAHQRGFAREDEANYIAYLTCKSNPNIDFQYSGEILALVYSMDALYDADRSSFNTLIKKYNKGIIRDLIADEELWTKYKGPINNINSAINDSYLKANNQKEGIKSYGRMVDLLIAQFRKGDASA